jgi:hypothetical protein
MPLHQRTHQELLWLLHRLPRLKTLLRLPQRGLLQRSTCLFDPNELMEELPVFTTGGCV